MCHIFQIKTPQRQRKQRAAHRRASRADRSEEIELDRRNAAYLENITAWCDKLTRWRDICQHRSRAAAAPSAPDRPYVNNSSHFGTERITLVKKQKVWSLSVRRSWSEFHQMTLGCLGRVLRASLRQSESVLCHVYEHEGCRDHKTSHKRRITVFIQNLFVKRISSPFL